MAQKTKANSRSRSPRDGDVGQEGDVGTAFDQEWTTKLEGNLDSFKGEVEGVVRSLVVDELNKFEAKMEAKFDKQAIEVQSVKSAVDRIEIALATRGSESSGINAANPFTPSSPPAYAQTIGADFPAPFPGPPPLRPQNISPEELNQSKFWRRPDEALVFANTMANAKVELGKWKISIAALAAECDLGPSLYKITGDPLGSRLEVRFLGDTGTAAHSAKQFLDSLKLGGGKYKEQSVLSPDNNPIQFFLNPDKPPCQVRK